MIDAQASNNPTIPTTVGALLTEECTINPLSPLPSFLELLFVDVARDSGRQALSAAFKMGGAVVLSKRQTRSLCRRLRGGLNKCRRCIQCCALVRAYPSSSMQCSFSMHRIVRAVRDLQISQGTSVLLDIVK